MVKVTNSLKLLMQEQLGNMPEVSGKDTLKIQNKEAVNDDLEGRLWDFRRHGSNAVFVVDMDGFFLVLFCSLTKEGKWKSCFEFTTIKKLKEPKISDSAVILEELDTEKKHVFRHFGEPFGWEKVEDLLD